MSDNGSDRTPTGARPLGDEEAVARLVRLAGRREAVPAATTARVRGAVQAEWERSVRGRRSGRVGWILAAAATLAVAAWLTGQGLEWGPWAPLAPAGTIENVAGDVRIIPPGGGSARSQGPGLTLMPGTAIETRAEGRLALRLAGGHSVRLDHGSGLLLRSASSLRLDRGALYVDSGSAGAAEGPIELLTPLGTLRDVGTQFEVRLEGDGLLLRVREGAVRLERGAIVETTHAGSGLTLDASGTLRRQPVALYGPEWDWMRGIAPPFDLDGRTLAEFLVWVARETGLQVLYVDGSAATAAPGTSLRGSVTGLTTEEALDAVLPTCGLTHRIEEGTLIVEPQPAADAG